MKSLHFLQLPFAVLLNCFCLIEPTLARSLQPGFYWGGGSRYITVAQKGDRFCFQGASNHGVTTASMIPDSDRSRGYSVHKLGLRLTPVDNRTILFGSIKYIMDGSVNLTADLQRCLGSKQPFFRRR